MVVISFMWIGFFLLCSIRSKGRAFRLLHANVVAGFIAVLLFEGVLLVSNGSKGLETEIDSTNWNIVNEKSVGYRLKENRTYHVKKSWRNEVVYDVNYTIDDIGLRQTPGSMLNESVLIFGGSFAFGTGLNDQETIPYRIGESLGLKVYNFGYTGYGAHQMLSRIENGEVQELVVKPPKIAIYIGIPDHVRRAAGYADWDWNSPRYEFGENAIPEYRGSFIERNAAQYFRYPMLALKRKSPLIGRVYGDGGYDYFEHVSLYSGIVKKSSDILLKQFPGIKFHVIIWDISSRDDEEAKSRYPHVTKTLRKAGLVVHEIDQIIPDFYENFQEYHIHKLDKHPSAEACRLVAEYINSRIVKEID